MLSWSRYSDDLADDDGFAFGFGVNDAHEPEFGTGGDEDPFVVCFSTRNAMKKLEQSHVLLRKNMIHLDATFKLNTLNYPSFVLSTSDVNRVSHVCVTAIASQRTQVD